MDLDTTESTVKHKELHYVRCSIPVGILRLITFRQYFDVYETFQWWSGQLPHNSYQQPSSSSTTSPPRILATSPGPGRLNTGARGGSGRESAGVSTSDARSAPVGLGVSGGFERIAPPNPFMMGQFTSGSKLTSEERFMLSSGALSSSVGSTPASAALLNRPAMIRTPSQDGPSHPIGSTRGEKCTDPRKQGPASGYWPGGVPFLGPVASLEVSNNTQRKPADMDSPEAVDRRVRALLNELTADKFDLISDQIIALANKSENEKHGRTLYKVTALVFEKATDEVKWSEMYARLCRKMMETVSPKVQDDGIKNLDGKPIAGGQLFRKYLLNRCQEDFERIGATKEITACVVKARANDEKAIKAANEKKDGDESELDSPVPMLPMTYSRRPNALGQGVPVKEGVSVPLNNVGSVRQGMFVAQPSTRHSRFFQDPP